MQNRLEKITFKCLDCEERQNINYDELNSFMGAKQKVNLMNFNTIVDNLMCSKCQKKSFTISDINGELIFDTHHNVICKECDLIIPFPRLKAAPGTQVCVLCKDLEENESPEGTVFPKVPTSVRTNCPRCQKRGKIGIVVVYRNSKDGHFFLGCATFPSCHWSSEDYWEELNGGDFESAERPNEIESQTVRINRENANPNIEYDRQVLFNELKKIRLEIAKKNKVPAFFVFSDRTLLEMADRRPLSEQELLNIHGIGKAKLDQYGSYFISVIKEL